MYDRCFGNLWHSLAIFDASHVLRPQEVEEVCIEMAWVDKKGGIADTAWFVCKLFLLTTWHDKRPSKSSGPKKFKEQIFTCSSVAWLPCGPSSAPIWKLQILGFLLVFESFVRPIYGNLWIGMRTLFPIQQEQSLIDSVPCRGHLWISQPNPIDTDWYEVSITCIKLKV